MLSRLMVVNRLRCALSLTPPSIAPSNTSVFQSKYCGCEHLTEGRISVPPRSTLGPASVNAKPVILRRRVKLRVGELREDQRRQRQELHHGQGIISMACLLDQRLERGSTRSRHAVRTLKRIVCERLNRTISTAGLGPVPWRSSMCTPMDTCSA